MLLVLDVFMRISQYIVGEDMGFRKIPGNGRLFHEIRTSSIIGKVHRVIDKGSKASEPDILWYHIDLRTSKKHEKHEYTYLFPRIYYIDIAKKQTFKVLQINQIWI